MNKVEVIIAVTTFSSHHVRGSVTFMCKSSTPDT